MKTEIHPKYHTDAKVTCSCGNTFTTGATQKDIHVEICSACHPFFTGNEKVIDAAGRVEKFKQRAAASKKNTK
ncbi:MAG TPA: 50S ribosomal protein L31 [Candidatus Paceibacterota bacterium]